jgi:DNA-binding transcriptional MerR regulator
MIDLHNLPPEKMYFSIGEVADMFGINASNIRYWEKEFPILHPRKSRKGSRMYSRNDLENLRVIFHLTKERGYTIDGARKVLDTKKEESQKVAEAVARLKKIRSELIQLKESL